MDRRNNPNGILKLDLRAYVQSIGVSLPSHEALIDSEELIFERALRPIFIKLGYNPNTDFEPKPSYVTEIIGGRREGDWGIYKYDTVHRKGKLLNLFGMFVEVKKHGVNLSYELIEKLAGFCVLFGSKYGVLANDVDLIIIKPIRGVLDWEYLSKIPTRAELLNELKVKTIYTPSDNIYAIRIASMSDVTEKTIESIADDCNDIIRRRKGMWSKKRQYEFSKLLLLRIQDEKEFVEGLKNELDITYEKIKNLQSRNINITAYFNTLFQSLVTKIGIFPQNEKLELNDGVIEETIQRLDTHVLWLKKFEILGQIYERFLMNTMTGRELGEYFTPRPLVNLTVKMVDPKHGQKVLDPACGTGGFLIYSLYHVLSKEKGKEDAKPCEFYGIEIDDDTHKLAKINSWLHNDSHENIVRADSLDPNQSPSFLTDALKEPEKYGFENILTNPPFGATGRNRYTPELIDRFTEGWQSLGVNLFECSTNQKGVIPQSAFLELCIKALKKPDEPLKGGRLGTIIDFGILSNIRNEEPMIRRIIRQETIIEAVIGLPKGAFKMYGSNVIPCILILRRKHNSETQGEIFRADIQKIGYVSGATRFRQDSQEHIDTLIQYWYRWTSLKGIR